MELYHYQMTFEEFKAYRKATGGYADPDRYRGGHKDYMPEMLCHTGQAHAVGTRVKSRVTCPSCLEKL